MKYQEEAQNMKIFFERQYLFFLEENIRKGDFLLKIFAQEFQQMLSQPGPFWIANFSRTELKSYHTIRCFICRGERDTFNKTFQKNSTSVY